jgi:hypothetical protein
VVHLHLPFAFLRAIPTRVFGTQLPKVVSPKQAPTAIAASVLNPIRFELESLGCFVFRPCSRAVQEARLVEELTLEECLSSRHASIVVALQRAKHKAEFNPAIWSFTRCPRRGFFACFWMRTCAVACCLFLAGFYSASAQGSLTPLEQQALAASNPTSRTLSSITMSGSVSWTAGSLQDSGNVVLTASVDGSSNELWSLTSQPHSLSATSFATGRNCSYTDPSGKNHNYASPECFRAVPWFAPWMSILMLSGNTLSRTSGIGFQGSNGTSAQLEYVTVAGDIASSPSASAIMRAGTAVGIVLDPTTSLIDEIDFDQTIDSDTSRVIPYRIVFSDYRAEGGIILPHHIQRFIQRTLQADITITNITAE